MQTKFPHIQEIKSVKYYYHKLSGDREIGLEHIEFVGFIEIGNNFLEKITTEYKWKETEKSKKVLPKINFLEEKMKNIIFYIIMNLIMTGNINLIHQLVIFILI